MKFPNPFKAFNKKKEGFQESIDDTTESVEISGDILTTSSTKKVDSNISWSIFAICGMWLLLIMFIMLVVGNFESAKQNILLRLTIYGVMAYIFILCMTLILYNMVYPPNPNKNEEKARYGFFGGKLFKIVTILFLCIVAPVIILLHPRFHFVEIFGNTIGYNSLNTNNIFNPMIVFKYLAAFSDMDLKCFSKHNFTSRTFPNGDIDLTPLINIFSVSEISENIDDSKFNNTFDDFMSKATKPNGTNPDSSTWNCDFIFVPIESYYTAQKKDDEDFVLNYDNIKTEEVITNIKTEIRKAAIVKHKIGEYVWLYIASLVATIASMNQLSLDN